MLTEIPAVYLYNDNLTLKLPGLVIRVAFISIFIKSRGSTFNGIINNVGLKL